MRMVCQSKKKMNALKPKTLSLVKISCIDMILAVGGQ